MLLDDEFELLVTTEERVKKLGFRPQKEILTNHLLPYADELDEESNRFLEQVKTNLAKSVMLREMKPACGVWTSRLLKYVRIYGLKFSKEDHIALIKLAYELVLIPDLEPCKIHKFITVFIMLTKKRFLIKPEELTLPWRPLFEVGRTLFDKSASHIGMFHYLSSLEASYMSMVKCARPYFDVGATKEMLEEFLPFISPWSTNSNLIGPLTFLPVGLHPRYASQGHELWFDKLNIIWDTCFNSQCGVTDIMILFANLAKKNPGAVDWSPHVPKMFMRFLHALNLPVSYKDMHHNKHYNLDIKYIASWIVWTINPDGVVLKHLRSFLAGVESYLHSANSGRWSYKLRDLLKKLAREFLNRVRREKEKKYLNSWENNTPESYKLREEDITEFVQIVFEPTHQAVYARIGSLDFCVALQNLATLRPAIVIPPLLEKLKTSLTSLTEPHRVTAAMSAVSAVVRPMLRGADAGYPEGPTHVVPILMAVLPGLDPNDIKKTVITLHFILMFSTMISYIDCSSAHEHWPDLTEEELLTCESTAQFEDFVLVLLDRLFTIIESSSMEHARLDTKDSDCARSKTDVITETAISSALQSVLTECSPKIFKEALRKFKAFATETTYETSVSGSMVGLLLKVFARIDAESTLAAFIPQLSEELLELLSTEEALREENPPRDLVYRLVLFMQVVCCDGSVLVKYMPQILPVLDKALKLHSNYALTRASDCLSNIFNSLSYIDLLENRCTSKDYGSAPEKWLPIREWGSGCLMKDANFKWHVPSKEEADCAQMLVDRYLKPEITRLRQWLNNERPMCRERRLRSFHIINSVLSCSTLLPQPDEEPILLLESRVPATNMPYTNGVHHTITLDGMNVRKALTRLFLDVQSRMLADKTDDTRCLDILIQAWERVLKNLRNGPGLEARMRSYGTLERALEGRGGLSEGVVNQNGARLRRLLADAARLQDDARSDLVCDSGITPSAMDGLKALYELSINTYSSVRMAAQVRLYWMLSHYPYSYRVLVPKLVELFGSIGDGDEWHAKHKGALCILLGPKTGPIVAKQDWEVVRALWPAILKAPISEKPSIHRLEQAFSDSLHRNFPATNTKLTMSESCVETAKLLLAEGELNDAEFVQMCGRAKEIEDDVSRQTEKMYLELVDDLVDISESPNVQWRRLELAMQMLSFCPSLQTPYTPKAVHLFVKSLLHENVAVRKLAIRLTLYAIKQRKRKVKKIKVDPYEVAGVAKPEYHIPGYREDLEWTLWSMDKELKTDEEWDRPWLRNFIYGYYAWPQKLKVAAPLKEQNFALDTDPKDMEEGERYLFEFFSDEDNINRLVNYMTVEEKKGKDKFNVTRFTMFRMIFGNFGERVCAKLIEHAQSCAGKSDESMQRFAAEVAAAALRAPRDWPRERAVRLQRDAMDIVTVGLTSVIPDSMDDWIGCVVNAMEKMDPIRNTRVLKELLELCAPSAQNASTDQQTSLVACAKLYALQDAVNTLTWRAPLYAAEMLKRMEAANFIQHPYQNIRENVGISFLAIFSKDVVFPGGENKYAPKLKDFLTSIQPKIAPLYDEHGDIVIKSTAAMSEQSSGACGQQARSAPHAATLLQHLQGLVQAHRGPLDDHAQTSDAAAVLEEEVVGEPPVDLQLSARLEGALRLSGEGSCPARADQENAINLLTTVLRGCMVLIVRGVNANLETHYELVPTACALASRGPSQPHEELPQAAGSFLASLALAQHSSEAFDKALATLESMAKGRSWSARLACLEFAMPLMFYGLPMMCELPERAVRAETFALNLMRDSRVEVRQTAAKLLTGLMHCRALPDEDKTLRSLIKSCRSKELRERHCGVLGLCAYLSSRPYSLGPKLGDVLTELSRHTNAPDPIPATIRTALADFRRTHQDDWPKHREQLTEEELDLLADLTSPPTYCA